MKQFLKKIIFLVNILFVIFLLLSAVSQYINPEFVAFPAFTGLAYPFLLLVHLLFIFMWIYRGSWKFLLSLAAILITWHALFNTFQLNFSNEIYVGGSTLKVSTYNVHYFNQYKWIDEPEIENDIVNYIKSSEADLFCLQEYWDGSKDRSSAKKIAQLGKNRYRHVDFQNENSRYGLLTLSKYPIIGKHTIRFDGSSNMAIQTDIETPSGKIRVFNVHLQSNRIDPMKYSILDSIAGNEESVREAQDLMGLLRNGFVKRAGQAKIIRQAIDDSPYPVIVCGDFNDTPVSYTYHTVKGKLKDCFKEAGRGISRTYNGKAPNFRIDYILCDPSYHVESYSVHKVNYSDHFPVQAIIHMN